MRARLPLRGYALLFTGMALVGIYTALAKPLTTAIPVFLLAWLRFAIAAVVMIPWLRRVDAEPVPSIDTWRTLFAQSFFGNFLFSILMLHGVSMTSATAAGIVLAALPPLVALLSWLVLGERAGARTWLAAGLAATGMVLLSPVSTAGTGPVSLTGNLLILGCAGCEAVYVILGKRLGARMSPRRISALINLIGLLLMTPFGLWQAADFDFAALTPATWALLLFYSLSASMVSTWLWLSGLRHVPASHSGVFTVALPLASSAVGVLALGEPMGLSHALALACAAAGIVLVAWPVGPRARPGARL